MAVFKKITLLSSFALIALSTTALCASTNFYRARPVSKNATIGFRTRGQALVMPRLARTNAARKRFLGIRKVAKFKPVRRKQELFRARPETQSLAKAIKTRARVVSLVKPAAKVRFNQFKSFKLVADESLVNDNASEEPTVE